MKGRVKEQKGIEYYMQLPYSILLHEIEDEGEKYWIAEVPELPGCKSHGSTIDQAVKNVEEAKKDWILDSLEDGDQIPTPIERDRFSGKTLVRMSRSLHRALSLIAESEKLSLNQLIVTILAKEVGRLGILNRVEDKLDELLDRLNEDVGREKPGILLDTDVILHNWVRRAYEQNQWQVVGTERLGLPLRDLLTNDDIYFYYDPTAEEKSVAIFPGWRCPRSIPVQWSAQSGFIRQEEGEPVGKKLVET